MMEWKWGAGSVDGIDLATYYYCYCVHMICNHDLEWGGWKTGMGTKESIFEVGKMTFTCKIIYQPNNETKKHCQPKKSKESRFQSVYK